MAARLAEVDDLLVFEIEHVIGAGGMRRGRLRDCWSTRFEEVATVREFVSKRGARGSRASGGARRLAGTWAMSRGWSVIT